MRYVVMGNPDITNRYLKDMRAMEPLNQQQQTELIREYHECNDETRREKIKEKLVLANQPFIFSMARHMSNGEDFNDLIDEGNCGLIKAIDAFDIERDNQFLTYAVHKIRQAMSYYISVTKRLVTPKNAVRVYAYSDSAKNRFFAQNGYFPSEDELQCFMENEGNVFHNKEDLYDITISSIDSGFNEEDTDITDSNWFDRFYYTKNTTGDTDSNVTEHIEALSVKAIADEALSYLSDNERETVCQYFGIGCRQQTATEIACRMGKWVTENDVEKLIRKYIRKIRKHGKVETKIQ